MSELTKESCGNDFEIWYREKNPGCKDDAIGFALFQCEIGNALIQHQEVVRHASRVQEILKKADLSDGEKLVRIGNLCAHAAKDVNKWEENDRYLRENACFRTNEKYLSGKSEHDWRLHAASQAFHEGKRIMFPWGMCRKQEKEGYPVAEIESRHMARMV